ncbi:MAG: hypothetical protein A2600_03740 [Candidatus Lambdaproteobacteria bacterium RIFOXYD1_FULL_56_27]|uniref:Uncharacterized protein n=1 Tax=Candidatus Lambdaproteobacteria bacterium RIFOXYD2_FULL_56_26 TaxID=1817773 RepID=A0A1F6H3J1_9PROT|nr:MAG: hypothetical protein A2426_11800 [Candidatus Lambdaproteobacteria bacterium RIFOXYC1_FULL_56_13]OGH04874.1 MAG: hypothetical protein A2557_07805 [Candidatus Lambdaproteobacteria bacterium RIFOXYD2_FULL_56_26]OGH09339.1 MAG: hypothetical protein A2600_03740 [Candidatus Lambdaproteobacteria bacterium RIFOXYD1_FULL_56_27]
MTPFWDQKPLKKMSPEEWESLCDHCGLCCLKKVIYQNPHEVRYTSVACRFLDLKTATCKDYPNRTRNQPECVQLEVDHLAIPQLMPKSCAYFRIYQGLGLPPWHPLVSGDPNGAHKAGVSLLGRMVSEREVSDEQLEDLLLPKKASPNLPKPGRKGKNQG